MYFDNEGDQNNHQPSSDNSVDQTESQNMQPVPSVKEVKRRKIVMVIVAVLFACVTIGALLLLVLNKNSEETTSSNQTGTDNQSVEQSEKALANEFYDEAIFSKVEIVEDDTKSRYVPPVDYFYEPTNRFIVLAGIDELNYSATATQKDETSPATSEEIHEALSSSLVDQGFVEFTELNSEIKKSDSYSNGRAYVKDSIICKVYIIELENLSYGIDRSCADISTAKALAEELEQYYVAYELSDDFRGAEEIGPYVITVDSSKVQDSSIAGYQYLYGGTSGLGDVGGANIVYVRTVGGEWVFFAGRQSILDCEEYDTELFKNALAHETCYKSEAEPNVSVKDYFGL